MKIQAAVGEDEAVLAHSEEVLLPAGMMRILDIETFIRAKHAMLRPHDFITIQHLQAVLAWMILEPSTATAEKPESTALGLF